MRAPRPSRSVRRRVTPPTAAEARKGALAAAACYLFWGLVPLYWRQLAAIDAVELIAHRHVWSLLVLWALLALHGGTAAVRAQLTSPAGVARHLLSGALLTGNWLVYVYSVNTGRVTECSLGYFLVPLVNVALGHFVLHEPLRRLQWLAIGAAAVGVALLVVALGGVPWIALLLASTWGGYSLMRKRSPIGALPALALETTLLAPVAIGWLVVAAADGSGALGRVPVGTHGLLLSSGLVTAVPLLLFGYGAQRIRLTTMGLLQYLSPTAQLGLATLVYDEPFDAQRAASFACIWLGLVLYSADGLLAARRGRAGG
jgi:chloramphenicol-sensitive protein RarD